MWPAFAGNGIYPLKFKGIHCRPPRRYRLSQDKYLKRGDFMLVGTEVVDFVKFQEPKSVEAIIGRPCFNSWTEFDARFVQDGTYVRYTLNLSKLSSIFRSSFFISVVHDILANYQDDSSFYWAVVVGNHCWRDKADPSGLHACFRTDSIQSTQIRKANGQPWSLHPPSPPQFG